VRNFSDNVASLAKRLGPLLILLFALLRTWIGRFSINADGISYLDLSDAFRRHDWHNFLNAYWSPLYPALLGFVRAVSPAGKQAELIAAHVTNFLIFLATLSCFEFFYNGLTRAFPASTDESSPLPDWACWLIAHALFLWASLDLITLWDLSPDLCVSAFVYAIAGLLLRLRSHPTVARAAVFGLLLGSSYWAKAVMFPLAPVFIVIALASVARDKRRALWKYAAAMILTFAIAAAPLVLALSNQKHRFTFGDSGRINYAMFVSPGGVTRNWQGDAKLGIVAAHPTHKIFSDPPAYEFAEPIAGTFPPWFDPTYWQEGRVPLFNLRVQFSVIAGHLLAYAELLLHEENCLLVAFLALAFASGGKLLSGLVELWPLLALSAAALALYMLVHVENRFIGGYVVLIWLALFTAAHLPANLTRFAGYLAVAVSIALLVTVADNTARATAGHIAALPRPAMSSRRFIESPRQQSPTAFPGW